MQCKRILVAAIMSFFLGILFYMIAAAILVDLPHLALAAEIRGRDVILVEDIIKPFAGNPPSSKVWNPQDIIVLIIVWVMAGLIGGFAGRDKLEGAIGTFIAYLAAVSVSLFAGSPLIGTDPINGSLLEIVASRIANLIISEELFRIILFGIVAVISGYFFGHMSNVEALKIQKFWTQLDASSNKIQIPFQCPFCETTFESNPLYCSDCGKKIREEVRTPTL